MSRSKTMVVTRPVHEGELLTERDVDDLAPYRAELAAMDREQADLAVKHCRRDLRVAEYIGPATTVYPGFWDGLSTLHARLRLAERRLLALGGPIERGGVKTRQKRNQNTKR